MSCEPSLAPIFIGGTGRSGTTILKKVIRCHSQLFGLDQELRILIDPGGALDVVRALTDCWSPYAADRAIHDFIDIANACARKFPAEGALRKGFIRAGISPPRYTGVQIADPVGSSMYSEIFKRFVMRAVHGVSEGFWAGSPPIRIRPKIYETEPVDRQTANTWVQETFTALYAALAQRSNLSDVRYWVDDTPYNILAARELFDVFPGMTLLHIRRDPRDVVASHMTKAWGGNDTARTARRVKAVLSRWREIKPKLPSDSVFEISLEELAEDRRAVLVPLCERLGIAYESRFETVSLQKVNEGRWQKDLSPRDAEAVSEILSEFIPK